MQKRKLRLGSSTVAIYITPADTARFWNVETQILQGSDSHNGSRLLFGTEQLRSAFGLTDKFDVEGGEAVLEMAGGDAAAQGLYIRYGNYLNIPMPGTGFDGDPNVSIHIDPAMRDAVATLLAMQPD